MRGQATLNLRPPGSVPNWNTLPAYGNGGHPGGLNGMGMNGMGVIAENINFPYDPHSIWNRNQLGDLNTGAVTTMAVGLFTIYIGYVLYKNYVDGFKLK